MFTAQGAQMPFRQFGDKGTAFFTYTQYHTQQELLIEVSPPYSYTVRSMSFVCHLYVICM